MKTFNVGGTVLISSTKKLPTPHDGKLGEVVGRQYFDTEWWNVTTSDGHRCCCHYSQLTETP